MLPNPVVTYAGGISGLPATKPGKGKKIDPSSGDVTKYADYLKGKHDQALSRVGGGQKLYDYVYSLNGFAAKLTEDQATRLRAQKNVLAVSPDEIQTIQTSSTPHFLGLDAKGGLGISSAAFQGRPEQGRRRGRGHRCHRLGRLAGKPVVLGPQA